MPATGKRLIVTLFAANLLASGLIQGPTSIAQTLPDATREMKPLEYAKVVSKNIAGKRPKAKSVRKKPTVSYVSKDKDNSAIGEGVDVGITFWRLREASPKENQVAIAEKTRIVKRVKGKEVVSTARMIPVRTDSGTDFSDGDIFRFSIEMPYEAYLYIINREQYTDGSFSEPYLVFPATADVGRTDRGAPGRLLYVPNQTDHFEVVSLNAYGAKKTAEVFSLIISPQPIAELPPLKEDEDPRKLDPLMLEKWEREWGAKIWKFERAGRVGVAITKAEKEAGGAGGGILTESDPVPQTVFHVARKAGEPLVFTLPVRIRN
jgi:hypothetical protein